MSPKQSSVREHTETSKTSAQSHRQPDIRRRSRSSGSREESKAPQPRAKLQIELQNVVKKEEYEKAAVIRDKIKELKKKANKTSK